MRTKTFGDRAGESVASGPVVFAAFSVLVAGYWVVPYLWRASTLLGLAGAAGTLLGFLGGGALVLGFSHRRPVALILRLLGAVAVLGLQAHAVLTLRAGAEPAAGLLLARCHLVPVILGVMSVLDVRRTDDW